MGLLVSLLKEVISPSQEYQDKVDDIISQGGKFLGSGDYGSVYQVGDKVKKVTSDEVEIEHALMLKGVHTQYFVPIINVEVINPKLAIITMPNMKPFTGKVSDQFIAKLNQEASDIGIDPEELDIRPDNFMLDSQGNLKMTDV